MLVTSPELWARVKHIKGELPERCASARIVAQHFRARGERDANGAGRKHGQHRRQASFLENQSAVTEFVDHRVTDKLMGLHFNHLPAVALVHQDGIRVNMCDEVLADSEAMARRPQQRLEVITADRNREAIHIDHLYHPAAGGDGPQR